MADLQDQVSTTSIALIVISVLFTALVAWFVRISTAKNDRIKALEEDMEELKIENAINKTKISPFWSKVQSQMSEELHHPHAKNQEMDLLLEKLEADPPTITKKETARLKELLVRRADGKDNGISESEKATATVMAIVMDKVIVEAKDDSEMSVELVAFPKTEAETSGTPDKT